MDFILRQWTMKDMDDLVRHANNFNVSKYLMDGFPFPYNKSHGRSFIEYASKGKPPHIFAIDVNGEAVGSIGLHFQHDIYRKNIELGYWLSEQFWGLGIMTQAIKEMVDYVFDTFDVDRIFARPFGSNLASQRVLQKAGFVLEARFEGTVLKNGHREDELVFGIRKQGTGNREQAYLPLFR